jgi:hypothetical protein
LRAHAYALQGRTTEAIGALEDGGRTFVKFTPLYLQQSWCLRKADVFFLLGRGADALAASREGTTGEMMQLRSDAFAGPYSRWSARGAWAGGRDSGEVRGILEELLSRGHFLDCIDRAEVLSAKVWFDARFGVVLEDERNEMWRRLQELPAATTNQLRILGMLDS